MGGSDSYGRGGGVKIPIFLWTS